MNCFYAVKRGFQTGIFTEWSDTEKQVKSFSAPIYRKFNTKSDAIEFIISKTIATGEIIEESNSIHFNSIKNNLNFKNLQTETLNKSVEKHNKEIKNENLDDAKLLNNFLIEFEKKNQNFSFDKGTLAVVYTDGACSNNGKPNASAGIGVFWGPNHILNVSRRVFAQQTNNRAEILAAIVAITQSITYGAQELKVLTDSDFMIKCMTQYIKKWKKNTWKTSNGQQVKNIEMLKKLDELCSKINVIWEYVPGHKGHYGNEEADKLARKAASS